MRGKPVMRVAMVGYAFMGAAHSQAWRNAHRFFDLPAVPELVVLCGRDAPAAAAAAEKLGWHETATDWHEVVARDDIDVVDVSSPGDTHRDIVIAALAAGKHVLCEKPLANTLAEAEEMTAAAQKARQRGVLSMVGFNYRRTPALALARDLVSRGSPRPHPPHPGAVPSGLDRRPSVSPGLAAAEGQGRLGGAR